MDSQYVAAVDIGTTKVIIAVAQKVKGEKKIEIVALHETSSEGVIKGDVRNLDSASRNITLVKEQIERELPFPITEVIIGLSGQHISCTCKERDISIGDGSGLSEITKEDLERLSKETLNLSNSKDRHVISILPQSYKIDSEDGISNPVGMEGNRLEGKFSVIEGEAAAIDRVKRCFQRSGLSLQKILLQPLASAEAVLSDDEKELGVAVVDIGGGTTDLCIYFDRIVRYVSVFAVGGSNINSDIKSIGILERQVEKLKTKFGEAVSSEANDDIICLPSTNHQPQKEIAKKALATIIEARMTDIVDWVKEQIEKTMKGQPLSAGIVLTGGGANLKNIEHLFKKQFDCNVRVAQPTVHLSESSISAFANPRYSTIVGMLYMALKEQMEAGAYQKPASRGDSAKNNSGTKSKNSSRRTKKDESRNFPQDDSYEQSYSEDYDDEYGDEYDDDYDFKEKRKDNWFKRFLKKFDLEEEI